MLDTAAANTVVNKAVIYGHPKKLKQALLVQPQFLVLVLVFFTILWCCCKTAAELNLIDGGTARGTTAVADGDGFLHNDGGTMRMTNVSNG